MTANTTARKNFLQSGDKMFLVYITFAAAFLGVQMFQGLSYLDIGMYMSGYRHFTEDPYASYFLGQWLLTYDLTSAICRLFSINSFLGIRMIHLVYVLLSQTIVFLYLRRSIPAKAIIAGLLFATLAHYGSYTEITYNDYSALLLLLSIISFHHGAERNKAFFILLSGTIAGAAVFFRIVNITYIGIPLLSLLVSLKWNIRMSPRRRIAFFYAGMAAGITLVIAVLHFQGLLGILSLTISDIAGISADGGDSHGMLHVMRSLYRLYSEVAGNAVFIALLWLMARQAIKLRCRTARMALLATTALLSLLMMNFSYFPSNTAMAVCLIGSAALFSAKENTSDSLAHLMMLSLYLPFVMPVGSNAEPSFYGKETCFLTLPLACHVLTHSAALRQWLRPTKWMLALTGGGLLLFNLAHKQMEDGNRIACRYTVDSPLTRHILTTRENADMYNHLIKELKPIVPRGSYMICQFSLPAVPILECKPWAVYSTVYSTDRMNDRYIDTAWEHTHRLPYLLLEEDSQFWGYDHILEKLNSIKRYHRVWTDGRYSLYYHE